MKLSCPLTLILSSLSASRAFAPHRRQINQIGSRLRSQTRMFSTSRSLDSGPSTTVKVGLCQFRVTEDKEINHQTCSKFIERATKEGSQIIVLPEIWASPYATAAFPDYAEELPSVGQTEIEKSPSAQVLQRAATQHKVWIVGGSIAEKHEGNIYNTCLVYNPDGEVVAKHRKVHLFDIDVPGGITFFESDTLSAGQSLTHFDTPWCKIGLGICYDIRFAAYSMLLRQEGCKILIFPGAFNMTTGPAHWELLQRARAVDNQCFVLTASPARTEKPAAPGKYPHYTAWGHSTAVSPWGDILASANEDEDVVVVDLDLTVAEKIRYSIPISKQMRTDMYKVEQV
ncbi:hypothetical protein ACA910_017257 [Epithemia clementina (nom. ined.)]